MMPQRPKILIVDDEEPILTMLAQILGQQNCDVQVTTSGVEALFLLAQDNYQLMITDINMPKMDGFELTRRTLESHPDLAIILTTAANNRDRAYQAYELGAAGYLLKPFDPNEIRIYVANALRLQELELAHKARMVKLEEQVKTGERRLKQVVGQLLVVLWALDRDGVFTLSEGKALKDLGLQPGQLVGQSAFALYAHISEIKQAIRRALDGEAFSAQSWMDGRLYENHYSPLRDANGELNGTICVSIDITESYQLQEEVTKRTRLASLGELAAGVAHEINNPNALVLLNSKELIKIFADIMPILATHYQQHGDYQLGVLDYSDIQGDLPGLLNHIFESAQRIKTIVSDLRSFASEDETPEMELIDLNQMIRSALPYVEHLIKDSTEHFSICYSPAPLLVRCMPKRLEQVIINLLQNSCQSLANKNASITLSLAHDEENQRQVLTIQDEGCGIDDENLARIKEPFFTTRRNNGGTGLGLSVSMRMVEECSGNLEFSSAPGVGTTAILTFPAYQEDFSA